MDHNRKRLIWVGSVGTALCLTSFGMGWWTHGYKQSVQTSSHPDQPCMRLSGYQYISPLLLCDTNLTEDAPALAGLKKKLQGIIHQAQSKKDIDTASVYFRDLSRREQMNINGEEKYDPASLNKVPVMMALYKAAESNPAILSKSGVLEGTTDYNANVEIKPNDAPQIGKTYSVTDLITMMITHSDNNGYIILSNLLGEQGVKAIYQDMQIQYPEAQTTVSDFMTAYQFSLYLRTLYNSTYLSREYSEKALQLLSEVDFKDGLVAGLPTNIAVAHKFGIETNTDANGKLVQRELHDCGIVYHQASPYLLCVMTKSSATLGQTEKVIQDLSKATFEEVEKRK